jgi:hypothetical protein
MMGWPPGTDFKEVVRYECRGCGHVMCKKDVPFHRERCEYLFRLRDTEALCRRKVADGES